MVVDLNRDWRFVRRRPSRAWLRGEPAADETPVELPHCWNERDTFQDDVTYYRGAGAYRRIIALPASAAQEGSRWWLESDGFYGVAEVWIDGRRIGRQDPEYMGLSLDVTDHLRPGVTVQLALRLTNAHARNVLPGIRDPDFLLYGGLAGGLRLVRRPAIGWAPAGIRVCSRPLGVAAAWEVRIEGAIAAERVEAVAGGAPVQVRWRITSPAGDVVAAASASAAGGGRTTACLLRVENARLWDVESPARYLLEGEVVCDGAVVDAVRLHIGLRTAEFKSGDGFVLNGRRLELRGSNRHECMPGFGNALPAWLHEEDARLMREAGLNFVRLSHYPQSPMFLDACDRLGLLVYAELASWKSVTARPGWLKAAERQWRRLIARDRHHPSIIVWGMGNESRSRRAYRRLADVAKACDPEQRPVTYAENHLYRAVRRRTVGLPDVWGLNYEFDAIEAGRAASRLRTVIVTECSNEPATGRDRIEAQQHQVNTLAADLARLDGVPGVAGFALWCFNDYATVRKGRQYRQCGIVDAWRQPKAALDFLRARHATGPFVRVWADWRQRGPAAGLPGTAADQRAVCVFTNCDTIRLVVNGRDAAVVPGANPLVLSLPFEPGELAVIGRRAGCEAVDVCASWSAPVAIEAQIERGPLRAGSGDVTGVRIRVVDAAGRTAAHWAGLLSLSVSGPARVRGYTAEDRVRVTLGTGRAFLQARASAGWAHLTIGGAGLPDAAVEVQVVKGEASDVP